MDTQFFLRGCWKTRELGTNIREACIKELEAIKEVLKLEVPADIMLTMIVSVGIPGVCAKTIHQQIIKEESARERSCSETVATIRDLCSGSMDVPVVIMMTMAIILPETIGNPLFEDIQRKRAAMTPPPDSMTPFRGPSLIQPI